MCRNSYLGWRIAMSPNHQNICQTEKDFSDLEKAYISLRDQEGRLYSDVLLKSLPNYSSNDFLAKEWAIRKESMRKLINYLKEDVNPQDVMELGCGNGWLSHALASIKTLNVTGVDINREELAQAARVFQKDNLSFEYGDVFSKSFAGRKYHKIIIAAAIQYFSDFSSLIDCLMKILHPGGEIHIIDSPFYNELESIAAKTRSSVYYKQMNAEAMIPYYHHHQWNVLDAYKHRIVKTSLMKKIANKAKGTSNPFVWVIIEKQD